MRVVYVAHQLSAPTGIEMTANRAMATEWCAWIATTFRVATVADWVLLSSQLPETAENRAFGLECDKVLIERCDELWMVGPKVSSGMAIETEHARAHGKPVYDLTLAPRDPDVIRQLLTLQGRCAGCGHPAKHCDSLEWVMEIKCCPDCTHRRTP